MLPAKHIQVLVTGKEGVPVWLGAEDHAWLSGLIDDFIRLEGRPHREVATFFQEPLRAAAPAGKRRMAVWVLQHLCTSERPSFDGSGLRDAVAVEVQRARGAGWFDRQKILAAGAQRLGLTADEADEQLFADLPGERRLILPDPVPTADALAARTNLALAQGLLRLACDVTVDFHGGARAVVRQVHLRRLLCTVRRIHSEGVRLEISGAFSLFRHTTLYGRALASILPLILWCERFDLAARCLLGRRVMNVRLRSGDPIAVGERPRQFDSRLESRFARDFARATLDWDLVREPEPVDVIDALVFPDFAIVHRRDPSRRFLLEIVGFWTPDYLRAKLDRLRGARHTRLVLCIDRALNCGREELPPDARVVWFHRRIDAEVVLAAIEAAALEIATHVEQIGLADLFMDWAGRRPSSDPVHQRLDSLQVGDSLRLLPDRTGIAIESWEGPVAKLSGSARSRWGPRLDRIVSARLVEKVERRAAQSAPQWRARLQCERWFVPVTEVVVADP